MDDQFNVQENISDWDDDYTECCSNCGSDQVFFDAYADQNGDLAGVYDHSDFSSCDESNTDLIDKNKFLASRKEVSHAI